MNSNDHQPHYSEQFQDIYYSVDDGLRESRHVFVEPNSIRERARYQSILKVGELGFGTGLNFFATWKAWRESVGTRSDRRLVFYSFEKFPLSQFEVERTFRMWPELEDLRREFIGQYRLIFPGFHVLEMDGGRVRLVLMIGDACHEILKVQDPMHVWYLDGFAPKKNTEMWSEELFREVRRLSGPGTTLTTFTVAGWVRRNIQAAGFRVEKRKGFSFKKEMTWAEATPLDESWALKAQGERTTPSHTSRRVSLGWHRPKSESYALESREAIIIGGGIAGYASAGALNRRGWQTLIVERQPAPLSGASSNPAGVFYPMVTSRTLPISICANQAYAWTARRMAAMNGANTDKDADLGQSAGAVELFGSPETAMPVKEWIQRFPADFARWVEKDEASSLAGVSLKEPGVHYPMAGWANFPSYARSLIHWRGFTDPGINSISPASAEDPSFPRTQWIGSREAIEIIRPHGSPFWTVLGAGGRFIARAPTLILANGTAMRQFDPTSWAPILPVRGQAMWVKSKSNREQLKIPLLGDGYCLPIRPSNGSDESAMAMFGSTYDHERDEPELLESDFSKLSDRLGGMFEPDAGFRSTGKGWSGVRCSMPDRTPMVGAAPDARDFCEAYQDLHHGMKRGPFRTPNTLPGLYIFTGLGSKGLVFSGWGAEALADLITGAPLGLQSDIYEALDPARFLIRRLRRPL